LALIEKGRALKRLALLDPAAERDNLLKRALEVMTQARELSPDNFAVVYNSACYKALLGMPVAQIAKDLKRAIELNPILKADARYDDDLQAVLNEPEIMGILGISD